MCVRSFIYLYVICYMLHNNGSLLISVFCYVCGVAYPIAQPKLIGRIDPSSWIGWVQLLKTFVNMIWWVHNVHMKELIGSLLLHTFFILFIKSSHYTSRKTEIILYENHVNKLFQVLKDHLNTLIDVY